MHRCSVGWGDVDWLWKLFSIISKSNDGSVKPSCSLLRVKFDSGNIRTRAGSLQESEGTRALTGFLTISRPILLKSYPIKPGYCLCRLSPSPFCLTCAAFLISELRYATDFLPERVCFHVARSRTALSWNLRFGCYHAKKHRFLFFAKKLKVSITSWRMKGLQLRSLRARLHSFQNYFVIN